VNAPMYWSLQSALIANFASRLPESTHAQTATTEGAASPERIIVSAQKRQQILENVPIVITAVSSESPAPTSVEFATNLPTVTLGQGNPSLGIGASPRVRGEQMQIAHAGNENSVATHVEVVYDELENRLSHASSIWSYAETTGTASSFGTLTWMVACTNQTRLCPYR